MEKENRDGSNILELKCRHKEETCFLTKLPTIKFKRLQHCQKLKRKVEEHRRMSEYIKSESWVNGKIGLKYQLFNKDAMCGLSHLVYIIWEYAYLQLQALD